MQLGTFSRQVPRYRALRPIDVGLARLVEGELRDANVRGRLFDPACGSGRWLARWAASGWEVAGNDVSAEMLRMTRTRLARGCLELTRRDPRALAFTHAPYDAAVDASGGERTDPALVEHLVSARSQLRPGGAHLLVLPIVDDPSARVADLVLAHEAELSEGRSATVEHRLLERVAGQSWRIRRTVRVRRPGGAEHTRIDDDVLYARSLDDVLRLAGLAGLEPACIRAADTGALLAPGEPFVGEALVVLRVPVQSAGAAP